MQCKEQSTTQAQIPQTTPRITTQQSTSAPTMTTTTTTTDDNRICKADRVPNGSGLNMCAHACCVGRRWMCNSGLWRKEDGDGGCVDAEPSLRQTLDMSDEVDHSQPDMSKDQCPTGNSSGTQSNEDQRVKDQCPEGNSSGIQYTAPAASAAALVDDDVDDDSDCCDLVDSSTEEELTDAETDDADDSETEAKECSETEAKDFVEFIKWRNDNFASVYVGQSTAGRPRIRRKVRRHNLPKILQRRGPIALAKQTEMNGSKDSMEERAIQEPNTHIKNKIVTPATKFMRSSMTPSPIETAAVEVIGEFNRRVEA